MSYKVHLHTFWKVVDKGCILSAASSDELWIGFNDKRTEGLFDWSDHSAVSFTSWGFGKPVVSIDTDDCVLITGEVRDTMHSRYNGAHAVSIYITCTVDLSHKEKCDAASLCQSLEEGLLTLFSHQPVNK